MNYQSNLMADHQTKSQVQKFEGFDFLRAIFAIAIVAYKTKIFNIPEIIVENSWTYALSQYILSGMFGALAVPVFFQISLFLFYYKSTNSGIELNPNHIEIYEEAFKSHHHRFSTVRVTMRSHADIPMGAMWCYEPDDGPQATYVADLRGAASVAHVYGKAATGAESMSAFGIPFRFTPRTLKPIVDMEFALGVNLLNIHTSPHQPEAVPKPGITLSPYLGQSFTRNETWAHAAKPWLDYLGRCSYLLQQGTYAADIAYFYGEEAPVTGVFGDAAPEVPDGYGFDFVNLDGLLNHLTVKPDGGLLTTGGTTYRLLYLGGSSYRMTLRALRRLAELLDAGALVAGWRPDRSPSQSDDPVQWAAAVDHLWGGHPGLIDLAGVAAADGVTAALTRAGVEPSWILEAAKTANLPVIHRQLPDAELYFISNQREQAEQISASFRGEATAAEWWDPVAASRVPLAGQDSGRTDVSGPAPGTIRLGVHYAAQDRRWHRGHP